MKLLSHWYPDLTETTVNTRMNERVSTTLPAIVEVEYRRAGSEVLEGFDTFYFTGQFGGIPHRLTDDVTIAPYVMNARPHEAEASDKVWLAIKDGTLLSVAIHKGYADAVKAAREVVAQAKAQEVKA